MKITFDHNIFSTQKYGGISRYIIRLAENLSLLENTIEIVAPINVNAYLTESNVSKKRRFNLSTIPPKSTRLIYYLNDKISKLNAEPAKHHLVHETYYSIKPCITGASGYVLTVHDMVHEMFPELFVNVNKILAKKRSSIYRADQIICISETTKNDLQKYYDVDPSKISVVHHGFDHLSNLTTTKTDTLPRNYILHVGQRWGYKNFQTLADAYRSNEFLKKNYSLVAFGGPPFSEFEKKRYNQQISDGTLIRITGDDNRLAQAYANASLFVFPSLYEGFGIPILEAMACRTPLLLADTPAFREVAGTAAEFFPPKNIGDLSYRMEAMLSDLPFCAELVRLGVSRSDHFSWLKCAKETKFVYEKVE
jgi:glycosyltransferase involved in cell wall biosynthesis